MDVLLERCAGVDIGKDEVVACVRRPESGGGRRKETHTFRSFTGDLEAMAEWFSVQGVTEVVMGATGPRGARELAKGTLRKKIPELRRALRGRFRDHHALLLGLCLDHTAHLEAATAKLDERVDALFAANVSEAGVPFGQPVTGSTPSPGSGSGPLRRSSRRSGWTCPGSRLRPTSRRGPGWHPGTTSPAGTRVRPHDQGRRGAPRRPHPVRVGRCSHPRHVPGRTVLRLARRIGKKKAAVAVGRSILVISWHQLTDDCDYDDLGGDYFTRRTKPDRRRDRAIEQLHGLGCGVTLDRVA